MEGGPVPSTDFLNKEHLFAEEGLTKFVGVADCATF